MDKERILFHTTFNLPPPPPHLVKAHLSFPPLPLPFFLLVEIVNNFPFSWNFLDETIRWKSILWQNGFSLFYNSAAHLHFDSKWPFVPSLRWWNMVLVIVSKKKRSNNNDRQVHNNWKSVDPWEDFKPGYIIEGAANRSRQADEPNHESHASKFRSVKVRSLLFLHYFLLPHHG